MHKTTIFAYTFHLHNSFHFARAKREIVYFSEFNKWWCENLSFNRLQFFQSDPINNVKILQLELCLGYLKLVDNIRRYRLQKFF